MPTVAVNPPKTPVTKGSSSVATATLPNICKMPPPPPPFVPTPLPNIGQSGKQPTGYSTSVKMDGQPVAIQGATFGSTGDIASKATGGGIISNNAEGPTKFVAPGSLNVRVEGKNVQYLADQMLNNCGPAGSPPNSATLMGVIHVPLMPLATPEEFLKEVACRCEKKRANNYKDGNRLSCSQQGREKHACCEDALQRHKASGRSPSVGGEEGYHNGAKISPPSRGAQFAAGTCPRGSQWPDAAALDASGNPTQFFDFKFKCGHAKSTYPGPPSWSTSKGNQRQVRNYKKLGNSMNINATKNPPTIVHNQNCK